jgi:hypothetical protein
MPRPFHCLAAVSAAACLLTAPPAARAAEPAPAADAVPLTFQAPKGWTEVTRSSDRPGLWRDWTFHEGGIVHSIVLSVTRQDRLAAPSAEATAAALRSVAGVSQVTSGPVTTCGDVPAHAYAYRSDRTPDHPLIIQHLLVDVGSFVGDVSYAHPPGVADRADALDALTTLCDQQIYALRAPATWKSVGMYSPGNPGVGMFSSPAGDETLMGIAVAMPARLGAMKPASKPSGNASAVPAEADETCGTSIVHRARWRTVSEKGTYLVEAVTGYRHGARYLYTYTRGASLPADPEAERALTSFCESGATLATPAPSK